MRGEEAWLRKRVPDLSAEALDPSKFGRTKPILYSENNEVELPSVSSSSTKMEAGRAFGSSNKKPARQGCPADAGTGCIAFGVGFFCQNGHPASAAVEYPETASAVRSTCQSELNYNMKSDEVGFPRIVSSRKTRLSNWVTLVERHMVVSPGEQGVVSVLALTTLDDNRHFAWRQISVSACSGQI
jgi:hypothetical protein